MGNTTILTDATILGIIKNVNLYSDFPALQAISKTIHEPQIKKGGCSKCQRNKMAAAQATSNKAIKSFKEYVRRMSPELRSKLKSAIGCTDMRFTLLDSDGRYKEFRY